MAEKTEKPTKKKLDDSAKKGQVAQSPNVTKALACAALMELALGTREHWILLLEELVLYMLLSLGPFGTPGDNQAEAARVVFPIFAWTGILTAAALVVAMVFALIGNVIQTGFMIAPESIAPDPERIDPIGHLKQMFTMEKVMELVTNLMKVVVISGVTTGTIIMAFDQLVHLVQGPLELSAEIFFGILQKVERMALLTLLIFAVMDWGMKKHFFMKQMMMEKQEVEREKKDQYGDKHVRSFRRKMSRELMSGAVTNVRKANAIVTNPTHFAVALRYHPDEAPLPVVLARGADNGAHEIIKIGRDMGIPIVRSVWLARTLYSVGREGRMIPSMAVKATAAVYSAILSVLEKDGSFDYLMEVDTSEMGLHSNRH